MCLYDWLEWFSALHDLLQCRGVYGGVTWARVLTSPAMFSTRWSPSLKTLHEGCNQ